MARDRSAGSQVLRRKQPPPPGERFGGGWQPVMQVRLHSGRPTCTTDCQERTGRRNDRGGGKDNKGAHHAREAAMQWNGMEGPGRAHCGGMRRISPRYVIVRLASMLTSTVSVS